MKVNVAKCLNGHFYDADKYSACPHCGAASVVASQQAASTEEKKSHGSFWKKKETRELDLIQVPEKTVGKTFGVFHNDSSASSSGEAAETPEPESDDGPVYIFENETDEQSMDSSPEKEASLSVPEHAEENALKDAVKQASASSAGKTVGYFSVERGKSAHHGAAEPVVGWLVCVKGVCFGKSFPIYARRNAIGRSAENKIVLAEDDAVSREKHAWITYEPKKREFYVEPGEGSGLTYLNGDNVMEAKKLAAKDQLEFGNGTYLLIPLCGQDFTWEDYMNKE